MCGQKLASPQPAKAIRNKTKEESSDDNSPTATEVSRRLGISYVANFLQSLLRLCAYVGIASRIFSASEKRLVVAGKLLAMAPVKI